MYHMGGVVDGEASDQMVMDAHGDEQGTAVGGSTTVGSRLR